MSPVISPPTTLSPVRPLKVHVVGSSVSMFVEPAHGPRDAGTYGEQLAYILTADGIPTVTTQVGIWFGIVKQLLPRYERDVRGRFPDVLVINFGMGESQSNVLPHWAVRHLTTWHLTSRRGATFYRRRVIPRLWKLFRSYQRWAGTIDKDYTHRQRPASFQADMRRIIDMARKEIGCLVLCIDLDPVGGRVEHWLPGSARRAAHYQRLLEEVVDGYDDGVRLIRASATVDDVDTMLPDGLHRTAEGHRRTAVLLADEIKDWLKSS
jgi:hypothetical protein